MWGEGWGVPRKPRKEEPRKEDSSPGSGEAFTKGLRERGSVLEKGLPRLLSCALLAKL